MVVLPAPVECIHPNQVQTVQTIFSPTNWDVAQALRIVRGNDMASAAGHGAWKMDGKMIDAPVVLKAQAVLERAKQCGIDVEAIGRKMKGSLGTMGTPTEGVSIPAPEVL